MKFKIMSRITALIIMMGLAVSVNAQTEADAVQSLKEGVSKTQAKDYLGAVESFKKSVSIYDELGLTENENRATAAGQITKNQYKHALSLYKQKKYDESIAAFQKLAEYSKTYDDPDNLKKANRVIPQLYYFKGKSLLDAKDYDGALEALNKSIELDNDYINAYLRKAQLFEEKEDAENFEATINQAITIADQKNDSKSKNAAMQMAGNFFLKAGADAFKKENWPQAEEYFNTMMSYKEADADLYYQMAVIHNKQSEWDAAIESANKALELMGEVETKDAKVYYELGTSYYGKGDTAAACDAYSKANKGDYVETAKYQMEHVVKCQ